MQLINAKTLIIHEFVCQDSIPAYVILSYTWGKEEVSFQEWQQPAQVDHKAGYAKINAACAQALRDGFEWVWVDTNCIDKTSSAELSEAINSMFAWYRDAKICYVHLHDARDGFEQATTKTAANVFLTVDYETVGSQTNLLRRCKWFSQGWTLQELLASTKVVFYSTRWARIGTRTKLRRQISVITGIPDDYLCGAKPFWTASISKRISWMGDRHTTRVEDLAYSMLGLFEIHMPLLYGEGTRAFLRLQEEILRITDDQTIFCWEWDRALVDDSWASILAPCPAAFRGSGNYILASWNEHDPVRPYTISISGLSIHLPVVKTSGWRQVLGVLKVRYESLLGQKSPQQVYLPFRKGR